MERVFSTRFEFHGKSYTTHVRQQVAPRFTHLDIEVKDEALAHLLPNGKLVYNSAEGLRTAPQANSLLAHELVGCIVRSVEPHLEP